MITVVCWKWQGSSAYHTKFTSEHVNTLRSMVSRHLSLNHRFLCITDDPVGLHPDIIVVPLWPWPIIHIGKEAKKPNCYRRLFCFSKEAAAWGNRILSIDLDVVILSSLDPLIDRPEDFIMCTGTAPGTHYNGSMFLLRAGTRTQVWERFDPRTALNQTQALGMVGSDQAWISLVLGPGEATWGESDGLYSYRKHFILGQNKELPSTARMVAFNGRDNPWDSHVINKHQWVRDNWR
jgi:hypothetical protein